jgi:YVTN family beta-propeller protein
MRMHEVEGGRRVTVGLVSRRLGQASVALAGLLTLAMVGCEDDPAIDPGDPSSAPAVFVVNSLGETLSRVLLADQTVNQNAVALGVAPNALAITPDGKTAYVVSSLSNRVDIVDLDTPAAIGAIDVGAGTNPFAIALLGAAHGYVSNFVTDEVVHLDLAARTAGHRIPVGRAPEGLLLVPGGGGGASTGDLYVAVTGYDSTGAYWPGEVVVIAVPADTVRARLHVGVNPQGLALAPDGRVHVVCTGDYVTQVGRVFVIDPATPAVIDSVEVGGAPSAITVLPGNRGYVVGWDDFRSYGPGQPVLSLGALAGETGLTALAWDETDGVLYVTQFSASRLQAIDVEADSVLWSVPTGQGPVAVAVRR